MPLNKLFFLLNKIIAHADTIECKAFIDHHTHLFLYICSVKSALLVFIGGGLGSLLRYTIGRITPILVGGVPFPVSILLANIVASALLGAIVGYGLSRSVTDEIRLLIGVGFCGGLSTFSSFSTDTLVLLQAGRTGTALLNVGLNVSLCLLASLSGFLLGGRV